MALFKVMFWKLLCLRQGARKYFTYKEHYQITMTKLVPLSCVKKDLLKPSQSFQFYQDSETLSGLTLSKVHVSCHSYF